MKMKLWAVVPFADGIFKGSTTILGGNSIQIHDYNKDQVQLFSDIDNATHYAQQMAAVNGGKHYLVLETTQLFYAAASPVRKKAWVEGELVPA